MTTLAEPAAGPIPRLHPRVGLIWLALSVVYVVWGSTYLAIRFTIESMPPLLSAGARFVSAGVLLGLLLIVFRGPGVLRINRRQLGSTAVIGCLLLAGGNGGVVIGERWVASGIAALLVAMVPLWLVLARAGTGDRPSGRTVAGVLVGLAGLVVLAIPSGSGGSKLVGVLVILGATVAWATGSFMSGRMELPANPFVATVYEMLAGGLLLTVLGLGSGELRGFELSSITGKSWLALIYLLIFGSMLAFTSYIWLLQHAPISLVATYAYVNPVIAVLLGALLAAEPITAAVLIGGATIVVGVVLVVSQERTH
ncbi:MAG: EamA family transporter [Sporichthyaceae bacterium]|nr:EamA family transporter [Sporichthyaceae bacterium]